MESQVIKRLWKIKLALVALACFMAWMGFDAASEAPELKQLKSMNMQELIAHEPLTHQYLELKGSEYLGYYVKSTYHGKHNRTTITLYYALGTPEQLTDLAQLKKLSYWVKLPNSFSNSTEADAYATNIKNLPVPPFTGVWEELDDETAKAGSTDGKDATGAHVLKIGQTPTSYGSAYGMLAVAIGLLISLAAWLASDVLALRRAKPLMQQQSRVFLGSSTRLLWAAVALITLHIALYNSIEMAWDSQSYSLPLIGLIIFALMVFAYTLWTKDVVLKVDQKNLEIYRLKQERQFAVSELRELYLLSFSRVSKTHEDLCLKGKMPKPLRLGSTPWYGGFPVESNILGAIREVMWQHLMPAYQQAFEQGRKLPFGSLAVTTTGLLKNKQAEVLAFDQIEKVNIAGNKLSIYQRGKRFAWQKLNISDIPNPDLLFAFLKQHGVNFSCKQKESAAFWNV